MYAALAYRLAGAHFARQRELVRGASAARSYRIDHFRDGGCTTANAAGHLILETAVDR